MPRTSPVLFRASSCFPRAVYMNDTIPRDTTTVTTQVARGRADGSAVRRRLGRRSDAVTQGVHPHGCRGRQGEMSQRNYWCFWLFDALRLHIFSIKKHNRDVDVSKVNKLMVRVSLHQTVLSTRRHPAHSVSALILHPREIQALVTKLRHRQLRCRQQQY